MSYGYQEPVVQLLRLGRSSLMEAENHVDYLSLGLANEHVPELIKLAQDIEGDMWFEDADAAYGPIHAWHALGQLQATEAIEPLISLLNMDDDSDWVGETVPRVLATFGAAALDALVPHFSDDSDDIYYLITLIETIRYIGEDHPELRDRCVQRLINQLQKYRKQDEEINAFLVSALLDLRAVEAEPLIDKAFKADRVDEQVMGTWPDVKALIQAYKNRPNDSVDTINRDMYLSKVMYHTPSGTPTKNYFMLMTPPPKEFDITLERTIFLRTPKRNIVNCPVCQTRMKNIPAPFVTAHINADQEQTYFEVHVTSAGYFCPSCPAVTVDIEEFFREVDHDITQEKVPPVIVGVVDVESIPAELANLGIYDIEPPPIVSYLLEGFEGALEEKQRSYVRGKKKKKNRKRR